MAADRRSTRELRTLAAALLVSLLLWNVPFGGGLLYPFKLLATWLHELSHAIAMVLTGAGFDVIVIYRDTSGLAYAQSKVGPVGTAFIASAGYMGTALWGAVLLLVTPHARAARYALAILAALLIASALTIIVGQNDTFGPWVIGVMGGVIAIAAFALPERWRVLVAHFIAAQACVNALLDIRVLLRPSQVVGGLAAPWSDAHNMANATFGTTEKWAVWTWASAWLVWSLVVFYFTIRFSGSPGRRRAAKDGPPTASPPDDAPAGSGPA